MKYKTIRKNHWMKKMQDQMPKMINQKLWKQWSNSWTHNNLSAKLVLEKHEQSQEYISFHGCLWVFMVSHVFVCLFACLFVCLLVCSFICLFVLFLYHCLFSNLTYWNWDGYLHWDPWLILSTWTGLAIKYRLENLKWNTFCEIKLFECWAAKMI